MLNFVVNKINYLVKTAFKSKLIVSPLTCDVNYLPCGTPIYIFESKLFNSKNCKVVIMDRYDADLFINGKTYNGTFELKNQNEIVELINKYIIKISKLRDKIEGYYDDAYSIDQEIAVYQIANELSALIGLLKTEIKQKFNLSLNNI